MFSDLLNYELFSSGILQVTVGRVFVSLAIFFVIGFIFRWIKNKIFPGVRNKYDIKDEQWNRFVKVINYIVIIVAVLLILFLFGIDYTIIQHDNVTIRAIYLLIAILIFQLARAFDWITSNIFIHNYYMNRDLELPKSNFKSSDAENRAMRTGQYFVYILAAIIFLRLLGLDFTLIENTLDNGRQISFKISNILMVALILLGARLLNFVLIQLVLHNIYKRNEIEVGSQFAINQLLKYVVYTFAFIIALDALGIDMTLLLGGAAALLVGIGLGLQNIFNDFVSGIVLLFERTVNVGDVLNIDGMVGTVKRIGLRASIVEILDNTTVVVPNSKLVNNNVVNWTHYSQVVRFTLKLTIAYGSDTKLVKSTLLEIASNNPHILKKPSPFVRFVDFGNSALHFDLYFFSKSYNVIEDIKSDLRFEIDTQFKEKDISIPYPQHEVTIKREI